MNLEGKKWINARNNNEYIWLIDLEAENKEIKKDSQDLGRQDRE